MTFQEHFLFPSELHCFNSSLVNICSGQMYQYHLVETGLFNSVFFKNLKMIFGFLEWCWHFIFRKQKLIIPLVPLFPSIMRKVEMPSVFQYISRTLPVINHQTSPHPVLDYSNFVTDLHLFMMQRQFEPKRQSGYKQILKSFCCFVFKLIFLTPKRLTMHH